MTDEKAITVQTNVSLGTAILPSPAHVVSYATEVSKSLSTIIQQQRLFSVISGRKYVQVEGWTTMGAMLGVVPRTVSVEEIMEGVFEATVELVRVSDGAIIGRGIAECGSEDETDKYGKPLWASRARYARKSMAITRATGKAYRLSFSWIMKLAGYEATPWEEMAGVIEGEVVEPEPEQKPAPQKASKAKPKQPAAAPPPPWNEDKPAPERKLARPYDAETFRKGYLMRVGKSDVKFASPSDKQAQYLASLMTSAFKESSTPDADRLAVLGWLTGRDIASTKDLTGAEAKELLDILAADGGDIDKDAYQEMQNCLAAAYKANGQGELFPDAA